MDRFEKKNKLTLNYFQEVLESEKFDTEFIIFRDDQGNLNNLSIYENEFYTSTASCHMKVSCNFAFWSDLTYSCQIVFSCSDRVYWPKLFIGGSVTMNFEKVPSTQPEAVESANEISRLEAATKLLKDNLKKYVKKHGEVETSTEKWGYYPSVSWSFNKDKYKRNCS